MKRRARFDLKGFIEYEAEFPLVDMNDWVTTSPYPFIDADVKLKHVLKQPHSKGSQFERDFCRSLSSWVSNGVDSDIYWRSTGSGGWATRKKSVMQLGDVTCIPEKAQQYGWLTDLLVIELKNQTVSMGDMFKIPFKHFGTLAQKMISVNVHKIPLVIMKSDGVLVTLTTPKFIQPFVDIKSFNYQNSFSIFDFRDIFKYIRDINVAKVWWQSLLRD